MTGGSGNTACVRVGPGTMARGREATAPQTTSLIILTTTYQPAPTGQSLFPVGVGVGGGGASSPSHWFLAVMGWVVTPGTGRMPHPLHNGSLSPENKRRMDSWLACVSTAKEFHRLVRNISPTTALKDLRCSASERKIRVSVYIIFGLSGKFYLKT